MTTKYTVLIFLFLYLGLTAQAQQSIGLISRPMPDSIMLRWAPTTPKVWRLGNQYGYKVKRYTILRDKKLLKQAEELQLTTKVLKPAPVEEWEPFADNKYIGIAAECIYASVYKGIATGGNPHMAYKKYQEEQQRYSFAVYAADQSLKAAELSGLYFADKTAKANEKYLYRVYINCPDSLAVDTAYVFSGQAAYRPLPKPLDVKAEWDDHKVLLSWNIQYLNHVYSSYIVEKSVDKGQHYALLDSNAIVQLSDEGVKPQRMFKSDTLPDNKTLAYYRIRGINAFGQMGPPSDSIFGTGCLPIKNAPVMIGNEVVDNQRVELKWDYPEEMNAYISGFKIYRSSSPQKRKQLILNGTDATQRAFTDTTPHMTNYYLLSVYSEHKEKLSPLITHAARVDSFPPAQPQGLMGAIDSTGHVTIRWQTNTDEDLKGYRVYTSNHPDFEYMLMSPSTQEDTVYSDSINIKTLTKDIYYRVKAEDVRQNMSAFSEVLKLTRPDIIPPVTPVIKAINEEEGKPQIHWINSSSTDVAQHHIDRKMLNDTVFKRLTSLEHISEIRSKYTDKTVEAGQTYVYRILAEDEAGLVSPPSKTMLFKVASGIEEQIKLKRRLQTDKVKLSWTITSEKSIERIQIYRSINNAAMLLYDNTTEEVYYDTRLSPKKQYKYAIKAVYTDGTSSALSKAVTVKM